MGMPLNTALTGGISVVEYLMRTRLHRQLTLEQAEALWLECKNALQQRGLQETVDECVVCVGGSLDTLPRGDVLDALAEVLTGKDWPMNMSSKPDSEYFLVMMKQAFETRAYARAEVPA